MYVCMCVCLYVWWMCVWCVCDAYVCVVCECGMNVCDVYVRVHVMCVCVLCVCKRPSPGQEGPLGIRPTCLDPLLSGGSWAETSFCIISPKEEWGPFWNGRC